MPFVKCSFKRIEDSFEIGIKPMRVSGFANRIDRIIKVIHKFHMWQDNTTDEATRYNKKPLRLIIR